MNKEWYEPGSFYQVPIISASLSAIFEGIKLEMEKMSEQELGWLFLASENLAHLCEHAMAELDTEDESD